MRVLALESSCDESAAAVLEGEAGRPARVLASAIASQVELHRAYGGVVPELASRNHSRDLPPLIRRCLDQTGAPLDSIDAFAATAGPGLASSLLIGTTTAKALALARERPFLAVNHLEGHLLSPFLEHGEVPPHLALVVSGGHTLLVEVAAAGRYRRLGTTRDDAAGEAFDKVAKMLGLPYPGGPEVEKRARHGRADAFHFPRSMLKNPGHDFSFSGLKTAVLYTLCERDPEHGRPRAEDLPDLCASFQAAVVEVLVAKTVRAARDRGHTRVAISGGVSLNRNLRDALARACERERLELHLAPPELCTDNAAMIAFVALLRALAGERSPLETDIDPNLPLIRG